MKRIGFIYEKIYNVENIKTAIKRASKGKRKRPFVKKILKDIDFYANEISKMLEKQEYVPSPLIKDEIYDGMTKKKRTIFKPKFYPDQIIHWAILQQIEPILSKGAYRYSCGSMPGKGLIYGKKYLQPIIQHKFKDTKYFLQMDIKKFYPSVNTNILTKMLKRKIKDKKVTKILSDILNQSDGLPIGTLLSQWFANFYLQSLDHFVKENLKVKYYLRYVDDMVIFNHSKKRLKYIKNQILEFLQKIGLKLKFKISKTDLGVDMLGFRFFRHTTILRKRLMLKISRTIRRIHKRSSYTPHNCMSIFSYLGRLKHCNCFKFYKKWVKPYIKRGFFKKIIKLYQKGRVRINENIFFTKYYKTYRMGRYKLPNSCLS